LGASNVSVDGQPLAADTSLGEILSDFAGDSSTVSGAQEDEALTGGTNEDQLAGSDEQTTADVIAEDLVLKGGKGDDALEGGAGNDNLSGGRGADTLAGGAGDDVLRGGGGDDTLAGGAGDDVLKGGKGDDTLEGGAGDDTLAGGRGADTFIQDFGQPGEDTIADFNPNQDVIDFSGLNDFENVSVSEVDGSTLISVGEGNTLTINNITPDQLSADNIKFDGEAPSADNFNLQSALGAGASEVAGGGLDALSGALGGGETLAPGADGGAPADSALGNALDNTAQQGASPAGGLGDGAAGSDIVADEAAEGAIDEEQVDEAAAGGG